MSLWPRSRRAVRGCSGAGSGEGWRRGLRAQSGEGKSFPRRQQANPRVPFHTFLLSFSPLPPLPQCCPGDASLYPEPCGGLGQASAQGGVG